MMTFSVEPMFSFGRGVQGELGRKVETDVDAPGLQNADVRPLALPPVTDDGGVPILDSVECGHFHCIAKTAMGHVMVWGANGEGQLGLSGDLGEDIFVSAPVRALDVLRQQLKNERISAVAGGRSHSIFVTAPSGRCFAAGKLPAQEPGQQADGIVEEIRELYLVDSGGSRPSGQATACSAGESQTFFLTSEGEVWSWLGDAVRVPRAGLERPVARAMPGLPRVLRITCGHHHTLASGVPKMGMIKHGLY
jgi:alpha-tubulin suppressor-like RCC1 family protein